MLIEITPQVNTHPSDSSESPSPLVIHRLKPVKRFTPTERAERLEELLSYIKSGFSVVVLRPGTKLPKIKGWCTDRIIDTETKLRRAFAKFYRCNWGIVTGPTLATGEGLLAYDIDVDEEKGKDGFISHRLIEKEYGEFPVTPCQRTPRGGRTYLFKTPPGVRCKGSQSEIAADIDIRAWHNQFAAAPSTNKAGKTYAWIHHPATTPLAEAPEWLLDLVKYPDTPVAVPLSPEELEEQRQTVREMFKYRPDLQNRYEKYAQAAFERVCEELAAAPLGTGHMAGLKASSAMGSIMAGCGFPPEYEVIATLQAIMDSRPGATEIGPLASKTIQDGIAYGKHRPRTPKDNDDALTESIKSGFRPYSSILEDESAEMDPEVEAVLAADHEHKLRDPEGYAKWEEEETERQREADQWDLLGNPYSETLAYSSYSFVQSPDAYIGTEAGVDLAEEEYQREEDRKQKLPEPPPGICRCKECFDTADRCEACREALSNRPNMCALHETEGHGRCYRGKTPLLISKKFVKAVAMTLPCGCAGCPDCGPGLEEDHRLHFVTMVSEMEKGNNILCLPDQSIHSTKTTPVEIQGRIAVSTVPSIYRQGFAEKLRRLMRQGKLWYFDGYAGHDQNTFFILMAPGFDPMKLKYKPKRKVGYSAFEFNQELIDYGEFFARVTRLAHEHGQSIRLAKSSFEMCDKPLGARNSHNRWNWCSDLRPAPRSEPSGRWRFFSLQMVADEMVSGFAENNGIFINGVDRKRFDRGHLKGRVPYIVKVLSFTPTDASGGPIRDTKWEEAPACCIEQLYRFLNALARKDVEIEPSMPSERSIVAPSEKGGLCYYNQSLF